MYISTLGRIQRNCTMDSSRHYLWILHNRGILVPNIQLEWHSCRVSGKGMTSCMGTCNNFGRGEWWSPKWYTFFPYSPTLICPIPSLELMLITINVYFTKSWLLDILYWIVCRSGLKMISLLFVTCSSLCTLIIC